MSKRIETNVTAVHPFVLADCKIIANDPLSTANEKRLALMLMEVGLALNELLCKLEFGQVIVSDSDEPPRG